MTLDVRVRHRHDGRRRHLLRLREELMFERPRNHQGVAYDYFTCTLLEGQKIKLEAEQVKLL